MLTERRNPINPLQSYAYGKMAFSRGGPTSLFQTTGNGWPREAIFAFRGGRSDDTGSTAMISLGWKYRVYLSDDRRRNAENDLVPPTGPGSGKNPVAVRK